MMRVYWSRRDGVTALLQRRRDADEAFARADANGDANIEAALSLVAEGYVRRARRRGVARRTEAKLREFRRRRARSSSASATRVVAQTAAMAAAALAHGARGGGGIGQGPGGRGRGAVARVGLRAVGNKIEANKVETRALRSSRDEVAATTGTAPSARSDASHSRRHGARGGGGRAWPCGGGEAATVALTVHWRRAAALIGGRRDPREEAAASEVAGTELVKTRRRSAARLEMGWIVAALETSRRAVEMTRSPPGVVGRRARKKRTTRRVRSSTLSESPA